jgi:2-dehydropantoate 2-reductase
MTVRVVVVGAGAVGGLLAWALAASDTEVTVIRRGTVVVERADAVVIDPAGIRRTAPVTSAPDLDSVPGGPPDLIVCAVKMMSLAQALADLAAWPATPLLTVQNGVGAEAAASAARHGAPLLAGSLTAAVDRQADGAVRWLRRGGLGLAGVRGPVGPLLADLTRRFEMAGLPARVVADALAMKWSKLVANLVGNATSAILDLDPAAIYADPALFRLECRQLREAAAVMAAQGLRPVDLPGAPVRLLLFGARLPPAVARPVFARAVASARGGKAPSLRLHLAGGRGASEVDWLNGAVVERGAALAVPTPVNAALLDGMHQVTADPVRRAWFAGRPDRLEALVEGGAEVLQTPSA